MAEPRIEVVHESGDTYAVTIHAANPSRHRVVAPADVCRRLAPSDIQPAKVIEESFRFLLEREPNTSILPEFELPLIGSYFPEYESEMEGRLS